jgi:DNA-directed RNA polymerase specialized sigma24 family protein
MDDSGEPRIPQRHVAELSALFAAHDRWLFGHACVRTRGDRELAADLVQDTFEAAARAWATLRGHAEGRQRAWLLGTLANKDISDFRRKQAFRRRQPDIQARYQPAAADTAAQALSAIALERAREIYRRDAGEAARDRADAVAGPDEGHRDRRRARRRRGYRARAPAYSPGQTGRGAGTVLSVRPGRREGSGVMTAGSGPPRDGAPQDGSPQDRADLFVADLYPKLGEYLAEQHAAGYNAGPGQARFQTWLGEHAGGMAGADPVRDYLKQIGKIPGLTIEQEAELAQRIEAGLAAERKLAEDGDHLTPGERIDLEWVAEVGARALASQPRPGEPLPRKPLPRKPLPGEPPDGEPAGGPGR